MANSILRRNHWNREWNVRIGNVHLRMTLQPTGNVLIEGRVQDVWYSTYDHIVQNYGWLTDAMYGRDNRFPLLPSEQCFLWDTACEMREVYRDFWDAKYAPGPDFTGG